MVLMAALHYKKNNKEESVRIFNELKNSCVRDEYIELYLKYVDIVKKPELESIPISSSSNQSFDSRFSEHLKTTKHINTVEATSRDLEDIRKAIDIHRHKNIVWAIKLLIDIFKK